MARPARKILFDKDIRALEPREKAYRVVVGNPSELILFVNPSGIKSFALRICGNGRERHIPLKRFRQGIYSVAEARKEAAEKLKVIESGEWSPTENDPWQRVRIAPLMALLDRGISHSKMKVIHWIVEHLDRENNLIYTQKQVAEQTQVARSTINELFKFLLDSNFMKRKGNVYHISSHFIAPKGCI